jgi:hypothetical protein
MNSTETDQIVQRLIQRSPVLLKIGSINRHHEDGPDFALYSIGCLPCRTEWIHLSFVQGQEEAWERDAKVKLDQHLARFHKGEV